MPEPSHERNLAALVKSHNISMKQPKAMLKTMQKVGLICGICNQIHYKHEFTEAFPLQRPRKLTFSKKCWTILKKIVGPYS